MWLYCVAGLPDDNVFSKVFVLNRAFSAKCQLLGVQLSRCAARKNNPTLKTMY